MFLLENVKQRGALLKDNATETGKEQEREQENNKHKGTEI
jgi:hypothetical protein